MGLSSLLYSTPVTGSQFHEGIIIDDSFSTKPASGYADYYEKVSRYADIIPAPAKSISKEVTEKTFKVAADKIAIIGLGGTSAYVLDLMVKTPVFEIHLFEGDLSFSTMYSAHRVRRPETN